MRVRLFLAFALIVLASVVSVALIARQSTAREVRAFMFGNGMRSLEQISRNLESYYQQSESWEGAESLLDSSMGSGGGGGGMGPMWQRTPAAGQDTGQGSMMGQHLRLADANGKVVADSAAEPAGQLTRSELDLASPLEVNGEVVGYLWAQSSMGYTANDEQFLISRLNQAALWAGLIAGTLSLLLALLMAYTLLRPIHNLTRAARQLAQGDLSQRVPQRGKGDELNTLGMAFNQMADSLQQAEQARRAMTADIAHELRTPLSVQRANLEAMQDGLYPLNAESLQPVLEQNLLLSRLVDDLRTLALADAGQLTLERVPTDFPALVGRVVGRFQAQAAAHRINLVYTPGPAPAPVQLLLDPMRIEQVLNNLLSNALRHTPDGGRIELDLSAEGGAAPGSIRLAVHDSGAGIPSESLPHLFERFYRADKSRARQEGGSGLGLTIARQLAQAHGGDLTAANHPQGGAVFTLSL
ncbi:MAG TPA: ATP-binding protein [Anaerolineales bacterium]|nr:ATP-binding protein [Anaerolineales bacterium]